MDYILSWFFPTQKDEDEEMTPLAMGPYEIPTVIDGDCFGVVQLSLDISHFDKEVWYALLETVTNIYNDLNNGCVGVVVTPSHLVFLLKNCESALSEASYISGRVNAGMTLATGVGLAIVDAIALSVPDRERDVCRLREFLAEIVNLVDPAFVRVVQDGKVKNVPECWLTNDHELDDDWVLYPEQ